MSFKFAQATFPAPNTVMPVVLIGPGKIGAKVLDMLDRKEHAGRYQVASIINSRGGIQPAGAIDLAAWRDQLEASADSALTVQNLTPLLAAVQGQSTGPKVLIDTTAEDATADYYATWLKRGWHIVTANKCAGAGPFSRYRSIIQQQTERARWWRETTVGAALPVLSTLAAIRRSGDQVLHIRAVLSGSLSWILQHWRQQKRPLHELIDQAKASGLTEPNPLLDIAGTDVQKKAVILARECGIQIQQINLKPLLPNRLHQNRYPFSARARQLIEQSFDNHGVLNYMAEIHHNGQINIGPNTEQLPASIRPGDNLITITSKRYCGNPLIIQGPGAGIDLTAGGIIAELENIARTQAYWDLCAT